MIVIGIAFYRYNCTKCSVIRHIAVEVFIFSHQISITVWNTDPRSVSGIQRIERYLIDNFKVIPMIMSVHAKQNVFPFKQVKDFLTVSNSTIPELIRKAVMRKNHIILIIL